MDDHGALQDGIKKQIVNLFNEIVKEASHFHHVTNGVYYITAFDTLRLEGAWHNDFTRIKLKELNVYKGYGLTLEKSRREKSLARYLQDNAI